MPPLISASSLLAQWDQPDWFLIDCRHDLAQPEAGRLAYAQGHLPGAVFVHLDEDLSAPKSGRNGRHPLPDPGRLAARLAELGLRAGMRVVAYDAQGGIYAARLWWSLRWLGWDAVQVLDGGLAAWLAAGGELSQASVIRPAGQFEAQPHASWTVDAETVLSNLDRQDFTVIDARSPSRYAGEGETLDPVGGHIPAARNRFFQQNLQPDGCFKPAQALREEWLVVLDGLDAHDTVQQCGSGVTACHNLLALEVAGLPGARLYPGSWSEWCSDVDRPVATGPN
ncbi:sulfurtransferase [Chitinimonas naiadis]